MQPAVGYVRRGRPRAFRAQRHDLRRGEGTGHVEDPFQRLGPGVDETGEGFESIAAQVGQRVAAGSAMMAVVPLNNVWIYANFKETQLEKMKIGQEVDIKLDAYPDLAIKGKVASLSEATGARFALLPADNASGNFVKVTQRVPVKIEIVNPQIAAPPM